MIVDEKTAARFWSKVEKKSDNECWDWTDGKNSSGYGSFRIDRKVHGAHRVSFVIANGEIPDGMHVLHTCDRPCCVNPSHLRLGTQSENMQDMVQKQRNGRGRYSLNEDQVKEIYRLSEERMLDREIGEKFGVKGSTVSVILLGETWSHLREKPAKRDHYMHRMPERKPVGEKNGCAKLTEEKVRQIRQLKRSSGLSDRKLGEMFGVSQGSISRICTGKTWRHVQ